MQTEIRIYSEHAASRHAVLWLGMWLPSAAVEGNSLLIYKRPLFYSATHMNIPVVLA